MSRTKIISVILVIFSGIYIPNVNAQLLNINGDTIFVNTDAEIQIIFPSPPKNFKTIPANTQYRVWNVGNGINLIPGSEDFDPVTLSVSEAERNHKFILIYKPEISNSEAKLYYDYSSEKKLAQHLGKKSTKNAAVPLNTRETTESTSNKSKKQKKNAVKEDSSFNYYALLAQGDIDLKQQNFKSAELNFNKARALRPKERIPLERLEEMRIQAASKEILAQQENNKKYLTLTAEGKDYLDKKNYTSAQQAYKQALELKPEDVFVTQQLQTVNNLLTGANVQNQQATNINTANTTREQNETGANKLPVESRYDSAIVLADNFFKTGDYDKAKIWYNNALSIVNKDYPRNQVYKINKLINEKSVQAYLDKLKPAPQMNTSSEVYPKNEIVLTPAERKKQYNLVLTEGKSSFNKNDYIIAKTFYEEANKLMPLEEEPKNRLKMINDKLEEIAIEEEINKFYDASIASADSLIILKLYEPAMEAYKEAALVKPKESYPKKQLQYIQYELATIEKRKKDDEELRYSNALIRADKAVAEKNYDDAKIAYNEALSIHPENEYAKKRLEIISYQLEKQKQKD